MNKKVVSIVSVLVLGYIIWSISVVTKAENEITYLTEENEAQREIIDTYCSYECAVEEVLLHNSEAGWDSLNTAQEKLDSLFNE